MLVYGMNIYFHEHMPKAMRNDISTLYASSTHAFAIKVYATTCLSVHLLL